MKNVKLTIEYDGTDFFGWQIQPNRRTVQGEIEGALRQIMNEEVRITGASRTDQGVHATGQVANFTTMLDLEPQRLKKAINSLTGNDVYIRKIELVPEEFHSRYSAQAKVYQYHVIFEPSPISIRYNWFVRFKLDINEMKGVVPHFLHEHDFGSFSAEDLRENRFCRIDQMTLTVTDSRVIIKIVANRFLRKMVRGIVGFMCDVGRGRFSATDVRDVFEGRTKNLYFAPPQGLFLVEVKY